MDVQGLKLYLKENTGYVTDILSEAGFIIGLENDREFRVGWDEDSSPTRFTISKEDMNVYDFKESTSYDIFELLKQKLGMGFKKILDWVCTKAEITDTSIQIVHKEPVFASTLAFLKQIRKDADVNTPAEPIPEETLDNYPKIVSDLWVQDGVGALAQIDSDIRYDYESNRIVIPIRNEFGHLVGLLGRINKDVYNKRMAKYLPIVTYARSKVIYGYFEAKEIIEETRTAWIIESEKGRIKAKGYGIENTLAIGKSCISVYQQNLLKKLDCDIYILALDEGIDPEHVQKQISVLLQTGKRVGFVPTFVYTPGSKNNIFDQPELMSEIGDKIIWCN